MHPAIKSVTFTPTGKTAERVAAIRAKAAPVLRGWSVRRSGAAQTVDGFGSDGEPVKITEVHRVKRVGAKTFALGAGGIVVAYLAGGLDEKTIALTEAQVASLAVKAERVADLSLEDCRMLARWADYQTASLWDDMTVQEILNVYRASWGWDTWEGWAEEATEKAREGWNSAVISPGNRMAPRG